MSRTTTVSCTVALFSASVLSGCSILIPALKPMPATSAGATFREKVEEVAQRDLAQQKHIVLAVNGSLLGACISSEYAKQSRKSAVSAQQSAEAAKRARKRPMRHGGPNDRAGIAQSKNEGAPVLVGLSPLGPPFSAMNPQQRAEVTAGRSAPLTSAQIEQRRRLDANRQQANQEPASEEGGAPPKPPLPPSESKNAPAASSLQPAQPAVDESQEETMRDKEIAAYCANAVKDASSQMDVELTLKHVRVAFGEIYKSIDTRLMQKHEQQYLYKEGAAFSGGLGAVGGLAKELNTQRAGVLGLLVFMGLEQLYAPTETKKVHLKAEKMFSCISSEIGRVSDGDRALAMQSQQAGAGNAADAVDIVIGKVDEAIVMYRGAILSQEPGTLSKADFERFVKDYASALADETQAKTNALRAAAVVNDRAAAKFVALPTNIEACLKAFPS